MGETKPLTAEQDRIWLLSRLREPFPAEHVGKLPRITCKACSETRGRCCNEHSKSKCRECDNYITERHMHLDYVGHGAVTDRLLEVDPEWSWTPLAFDEQGMPTFIYDHGSKSPTAFWIKLTVLGVERLGVGTCPADQADAEKVLIGDALRNAAMRFGAALDLWIKGHGEDDERRSAVSERSYQQPPAEPVPPKLPEGMVSKLDAMTALIEACGGDRDMAKAIWEDQDPTVTEVEVAGKVWPVVTEEDRDFVKGVALARLAKEKPEPPRDGEESFPEPELPAADEALHEARESGLGDVHKEPG